MKKDSGNGEQCITDDDEDEPDKPAEDLALVHLARTRNHEGKNRSHTRAPLAHRCLNIGLARSGNWVATRNAALETSLPHSGHLIKATDGSQFKLLTALTHQNSFL